MRGSELMRSDEDTDHGSGAAEHDAPRTAAVDGDTLLREVDTPHLRNEVQRRLFGKAYEPVRIGRFPVLRRIGQGGMGVVFAAFDNELDRKVAIKLLRPGLGEDSVELRDRLLREAKALARLSHPSIVQVYEAGEHDGQVFLAMEFVEGHSLRQWCDAEPRSVRELLDRFLQAGEGLAAAHAAGLVHRDFKPDNVIVGTDGRVRVLDFGLAAIGDDVRRALPAGDEPIGPVDRLTRTGALLGTPAYMAPEQLLGEPADARSDQFSFAVALYESLFGVRPFAGETYEQLRTAVVKGEITGKRGRSGTASIARVLRRALAADREQRYPDLDRLLAALRATQRGRGLILAGAVTAAVGVGGFMLVQASRDAEFESLTQTVQSLGTEVQGERTRADDAEAQLRQRADVLAIAEARFAARRDPSLALALLARLSDDDEMWGDETWSLAQSITASVTADEIVPVPADQTARRLTLAGQAVLLRDQDTEGLSAWWPWDDRRLVLANSRALDVELDERRRLVQTHGSEHALLWDLEAGAVVVPVLDAGLTRALPDHDARTLVVQGAEFWSAVDLVTFERRELRIPAAKMLLDVGPAGAFGIDYDLVRIDADGTVRSGLDQRDDDRSMIERFGDGRYARLIGTRLQLWDSRDDTERTVDLLDVGQPSTMTVSEGHDRVAIGHVDGTITIIDTATSAQARLQPTAARVESIEWLDGDRQLFAGTPDGGVLVDVEHATTTPLLAGRAIDSVTLDAHGRLVTLSDADVRRWSFDRDDADLPRGRDLVAVDGPTKAGTYVALRSDGELVRWANGAWVSIGRHVGATVLTIAGDRVVTAGTTGLVAWSLATGESRRLRERLDPVALIEAPAVDPAGRYAVIHAEGPLQVIDLADGSMRTIASRHLITDPAFAPDAPRFYASETRGSGEFLRRWDTETWQELPEVPVAEMVIAIAPGERVVLREREQVVLVDLADPRNRHAVPTGFVTAARVSDDGRTLLGLRHDGRTVLADVESGRVGELGPRLRDRPPILGEPDARGRLDERRVVLSPDASQVLAIDATGALQTSRPLPPMAPSALRAWVRERAPEVPAEATLERLVPRDEK